MNHNLSRMGGTSKKEKNQQISAEDGDVRTEADKGSACEIMNLGPNGLALSKCQCGLTEEYAIEIERQADQRTKEFKASSGVGDGRQGRRPHRGLRQRPRRRRRYALSGSKTKDLAREREREVKPNNVAWQRNRQ